MNYHIYIYMYIIRSYCAQISYYTYKYGWVRENLLELRHALDRPRLEDRVRWLPGAHTLRPGPLAARRTHIKTGSAGCQAHTH